MCELHTPVVCCIHGSIVNATAVTGESACEVVMSEAPPDVMWNASDRFN